MKTYLDCIPCFMSQALRAGRISGMDEAGVKNLLDEVSDMIKNLHLESSPPKIVDLIFRKTREISGVNDPYREIKKETILEALALCPELNKILDESDNRLLTAVKIAIAGNVIDFGVDHEFNIAEEVRKVLDQDCESLHFDEFRRSLDKAKSILYLGDNSGESVFDKMLIAEFEAPVTYVVRDVPVINDVTMQDAIDSGLDEVAEIISSGNSVPAIIPDLCSAEFLNHFENADLIISKGQGNYEGLSNSTKPVFFMLKAKCEAIARDLNVNKGDIVLASSSSLLNN